MSNQRKYPVTSRRLAWECLQQWASGRAFAESLVEQSASKHELSSPDRALLQAIVYGTIRHRDWMFHICRMLRSAPLEESLIWLVSSACYQLFVMGQPDYAVVNETVNLVPARARGVVNGMLRNALRRRDEILADREQQPLSIRYSTPEWIVQRWTAAFGADETEALLRWNETNPVIYARINPINPPVEIPEMWEGLENLPLWYRVKGTLPKDLLAAGQVYIADPSTRHCVRLLAPVVGERILDACAAPGGKSLAMIAATKGDIHLLCTDSQEHRLGTLAQNLQAAGAKDVLAEAHDWTKACPDAWVSAFDAVLLDVPCSNSGVFQRRVDARWRLTKDEMARITALQWSILNNAQRALKLGGRLVYSTCSIDPEENQKLVARFIEQNSSFELKEEYLAMPHQEQADGAYAALIVKISE